MKKGEGVHYRKKERRGRNGLFFLQKDLCLISFGHPKRGEVVFLSFPCRVHASLSLSISTVTMAKNLVHFYKNEKLSC